VAGEVVDEQDAVEVVELVEQHARVDALALDVDRLAVDVGAAQVGTQWALRRVVEAGERQAALVGLLELLGQLDDLGVHEVAGPARRLPHEQALEHANLVRRDRGAARTDQREAHVLGEPAQRVVEVGDLERAGPQDRVAEDADAKRGHRVPWCVIRWWRGRRRRGPSDPHNPRRDAMG
jgi:hypothetical protein